MNESIWIVVPAYNEEDHINKVIEDLNTNGYHNIVVVDDGSKDATQTVAAKAGATVLSHIINRGQGAALKTGIDYSLLEGADYIVTFDSDGQHQATDIKSLLQPLNDGAADITLGSRFLRPQGQQERASPHIPFSRRILLKGSVLVIALFYGISMTDAHNGFRAMTRHAAEQIQIKSNRMEHASEIINEIRRNNLRYLEKPVTVRYDEERHLHGQGSFVGAIRIFLKMVLHKLMR